MKPSPTASKRTKNRLREHPNLVITKESNNLECFPNQTCVFLKSTDGWVGWIPKDEIE